jgi:hypothetical protein
MFCDNYYTATLHGALSLAGLDLPRERIPNELYRIKHNFDNSGQQNI